MEIVDKWPMGLHEWTIASGHVTVNAEVKGNGTENNTKTLEVCMSFPGGGHKTRRKKEVESLRPVKRVRSY